MLKIKAFSAFLIKPNFVRHAKSIDRHAKTIDRQIDFIGFGNLNILELKLAYS